MYTFLSGALKIQKAAMGIEPCGFQVVQSLETSGHRATPNLEGQISCIHVLLIPPGSNRPIAIINNGRVNREFFTVNRGKMVM